MPRPDYTAPTFTDVPQAQWGSPPAGAVAWVRETDNPEVKAVPAGFISAS